jgi:hypothetical protein
VVNAKPHFLVNRQKKLVKYGATNLDLPLYAIRTQKNGKLYHLYDSSEMGPEHEQFFAMSQQGYRTLQADSMNLIL